jgi:hypothetical protein
MNLPSAPALEDQYRVDFQAGRDEALDLLAGVDLPSPSEAQTASAD